ncbi:response regulator transcription factor [Pseudaquabacterium rugosum]|jgi:two-component system response regulator TctD|uniref:Response regulator transcription factor n=1 Tax=Pseudaquabacterium rugosum TaxID=2984194 RepID=A0ABU9BEF1_9BURK
MLKLLLIEDDPDLQATLVRTFARRQLQVVACADGARALDRWRASVPDVVLLDLSLPGRDGLQVLGDARAEGLTTPVIILTARGTVGDRILGLNTGADDYLPKPFDLDELEARVRALARRQPARTGPGATGGPAAPGRAGAPDLPPAFCGLRADADSGAVYWHSSALELAPREAALLRALLARPGQAVAKERLFELVFPGQDEVQLEAIEVVAYRLRKRLADTGARLVTLRGLGYLLKADGDAG